LKHIEVGSRSSNGGLEDGTHGSGGKLELATSNRNNKKESMATRERGDSAVEFVSNCSLNDRTGAGVEIEDFHTDAAAAAGGCLRARGRDGSAMCRSRSVGGAAPRHFHHQCTMVVVVVAAASAATSEKSRRNIATAAPWKEDHIQWNCCSSVVRLC
jgi:hypothetical protein